MNTPIFDRICKLAEARNRGWIRAGDVIPCRVIADGVELTGVRAVHRKSGRLQVVDNPIRLDKHRKRVLFRTLHAGHIELVQIKSSAMARTSSGEPPRSVERTR
ncbi:hypothetical protein SAMN05216359_105283 [Roseateles sp. YR242]|uniref:hypothetical protein n=1 Tax=Roseateles sp. YR242 TaxID=1855305 RepID=UPI0008B3400D|nr:hypothetical protein [Roseateles sp. YR242]SEL12408.1 hypothetical protein SAMN05216359_105283 [Roseateles sp. YR242]